MSETSTPQRLSPLLPDEWNEDILDALGVFPTSRNFVLTQWKEQTGDKRGLNTLGFLAHYPELAKAYLTLNKHLSADSSLAGREKELVILRAAWVRGAHNEFLQHIILGRRLGLSEEELKNVTDAVNAFAWSEQDQSILNAVDDLGRDNRISNASFEQLQKHFSQQQIMDMIYLVGCYSMMGSAINSFNIPIDEGMESHDPLIPGYMEKMGK